MSLVGRQVTAVMNAEMSRKKNRKFKPPGHYCWACDQRRPNERFAGSGHARHLCKQCTELGAEELAYRQARRDLERCATWEGIIPRKRRKAFQAFLNHDDPRIRAMAEQLHAGDREARELLVEEQQLDETASDRVALGLMRSGPRPSDGEHKLAGTSHETTDHRLVRT